MPLSAAQSALDHAWRLVRKGEVDDARFWASEAANLDPGLEEAWLILAATSNPIESFEFLQHALEINPQSRRGNKGVVWAETKTGRSFSDFLAKIHHYITGFNEPRNDRSFDPVAIAPFEIPSNKSQDDSFYDYPDINENPFSSNRGTYPSQQSTDNTADPIPPPQTSVPPPPPVDELRTIIRRKKPRPRPTEPVNPWSVLLPYTVSFVLFLFLSTIWLLSGLPSVRAESNTNDYSTNELVSRILTANPKPTLTITPSATPLPSKTSTKIPTITLTFTPEPSATPIPPSSEVTQNPNSESMPVLIGDQIADTLEDGRWIEVDLKNQKVRAYEMDKVLKEFVVSTGTASHPTVKGSYHIYIKNRYADMRGPGYYLPNVPYTMYFYHSYGLHGTYWHHNFGTPMSHGCVNLKTEDAAWLFNWASIGTLVHVH